MLLNVGSLGPLAEPHWVFAYGYQKVELEVYQTDFNPSCRTMTSLMALL